MKKLVKLFALFLMFVFHTSCGQNQTNAPQDNISKGLYSESQLKEAATSKVPMSMVRNVKQDRNGNILIASYMRCVFRYDGKSFTNLTSKIGSPASTDSGMFWKIEKEIFGSLPMIQVFIITIRLRSGQAGNPCLPDRQAFNILQPGRDLPVMQLYMSIYEDKAGIIWFGTNEVE